MPNPGRPGHVNKGRRKGRRIKPRKSMRRKDTAASKKKAPEGSESVRHYGEYWEYEHYEKESLKAQGIFL